MCAKFIEDLFVSPLFTKLLQIRRDCLTSILLKLVDIIQQIQTRPLTKDEKNEMKNAVLDRIGCGLGAQRLALGQEISSIIQHPCEGASTIWGTGIKIQAHLAALINGASSSHLEYDSHDSMIPATIALGEELSSGGESILHARARQRSTHW